MKSNNYPQPYLQPYQIVSTILSTTVMSCLHIVIANAYLNAPTTVLKVGDIQHSCMGIQIRMSNTFCIHLNLISSNGASLLAQYECCLIPNPHLPTTTLDMIWYI